MNSNRRQWLLGGVLGLIGFAYVGDLAYQRLYAKPMEDVTRRKKALDDELLQIELAIRASQKKLPQLDELRSQSLPAQPELAVSQYRAWLFELIERHGIKSPAVDPGQPTAFRRLYRKIPFSVRGTATLDQVTRFLHAFYSAGYLHKINSMTINPNGNRVALSISIEAISLPSADNENLIASKANRLASETYEPYRLISQRNLFSGSGNDWLNRTSLTAITADREGNAEAWFNRASGPALILKVDDETLLSGCTLRIISMAEDRAIVELDGTRMILRLGQSLTEGQEILPQNE